MTGQAQEFVVRRTAVRRVDGSPVAELTGERTICLFLPDGRLAFSYARSECTSNKAFDAAGLHIAVREPFRMLEVAFGN